MLSLIIAHSFQLQIESVRFLPTKKRKKKAQDVTWRNGLNHFSINAVTNRKFLNHCCNTPYFFIKKEETDSS